MTIYIIILTAIVSVLAMQNRELMSKLMFNAYLVKHSNEWYRALSHALIHSGWMHLFVNMWVLYLFGRSTENFFEAYLGGAGPFVYLTLYVGGVLFATLPSYRKHQDNFNYNAVGASGAVAAVLFSAIYFTPTIDLYLMFIPIPIPAVVFGVGYLALEWYLDKKGNDHIAHDAHFWGAAFGFVFSVVMVREQFPQFLSDIANRFLG